MAKTKISKVAKDINVALPTVVEFLRKKGITVEDNPNARIDDDVYDLLVKEYAPDKAVKSQAAQVLSERQKEKAVSYTHLDVYKRQFRNSRFRKEYLADNIAPSL